MELFKNIFAKDCILRSRIIVGANSVRYGLLYFDGMVNVSLINESIIRPIVVSKAEPDRKELTDFVIERVLFAGEAKATNRVGDILRSILYGDALLLIEGSDRAITINAKGWRSRGISEPENERILQGPREGFDEAAMFNLAMIRRKLLTPDLCIEAMRIGRRTDTFVFICYLGSLADKKTLLELKKRLSKIDIDGILDTNYIGEQIRDSKGSVFKTTGMTERPDVVAADMLEGRIALVVDGTPVVLTLPFLFSENFQSDEDYYINYRMASVSRILRIVCFMLTVSLPGIFLAALTFHIQLIPTVFTLSIAEARQGVPFSPTAECLVLLLIFEILKEAGLRMPQGVGHTLSIVGGLVVGQAAVEAKIVSAHMLIAVALSGIAGLMVPRLKTAVFYCRIFLTLLGATLGIYGILVGGSFLLCHILSLKSFGVDYTQSLRRPNSQTLKDILWRSIWGKMITRPDTQRNNRIRQNKNEEV